jgi:sucrose phosphorylase
VNEAALKNLERLSAFIYGDETGGAFAANLRAVMDEAVPSLRRAGAVRSPGVAASAASGTAAGAAFSEKDALLITYGDMLSPASVDSGESALSRLRSFLRRRARGLFSYVHILPFFPYSSDDGFSVIDYRQVDPRLGSWNDVESIGGDFKLGFDLVLNHGSVGSEWFKAFLAGAEPYDSWYLTRDASYDASTVFRPRTHPLLTAFKKADGETVHVWTTFSADQADFDFGNPRVFLEFVRVFLEYVLRGARLIRLDAVAFLWKEDGTPCLHHPKTHAAVKLLRSLVDALELDTIILTETNVPHPDNVSYYGAGDEAHMVYNFALPPLLLHAAVSGDAGPLRRWAAALPPPGNGPVFLNFTASHDGIGVGAARGLIPDADFARTIAETEKRGGRVSFKTTPAGPVPYELNCVYLDAVAPPVAGIRTRARAFLATQAAMLSLAGLPAVYFHSLIGSGNWREGPELLGYNRAINRQKPPADALEAVLADAGSLRSLVYDGFSRLLAFRGTHPAFSPDVPQRVLPAEGAVFALLRGPDASGGLVFCAHNLGPEAARIPLPTEFGGGEAELSPWETKWTSSDRMDSVCI